MELLYKYPCAETTEGLIAVSERGRGQREGLVGKGTRAIPKKGERDSGLLPGPSEWGVR